MNSLNRIDFSDRKNLEKYSSAFTLSDMEMFVFPELFFPLVLSNIMSPVIWKWREDPWFENMEGKKFLYRVNRIKQYIIQNYIFNLDLATWGLTTKEREIERFRSFIDMETLRKSNALFGYEGDKYYFDIDIRKHFGLDRYDSDIIPYWKTETVEAMNAFRHKNGFTTGAGECVSLSALYAAAMFIVGRVPLEKIFLIATPLHSQNFILEKDGFLTNNRRILTKNMWFNGTSLSAKARRALENEKITIVSHISGHIHILYDEATVDPEQYRIFSNRLKDFLRTDLNTQVFINFLRFKSKYKSLFQFRCDCQGYSKYIPLDKMFEYEHNSRFNAGPETRHSLLNEMEPDEFNISPYPNKLILNDFEEILVKRGVKPIDVIEKEFIKTANKDFAGIIIEMTEDIKKFLVTEPRLPSDNRKFIRTPYPEINTGNSEEEIADEILSKADHSEMCRLALYAHRQMDRIDWLPFIKAAIERNPVSFDSLQSKNINEIYNIISRMPDNSIYEGKRLALPDEVWNFGRGDGIEKSILLACNIAEKDREAEIEIIAEGNSVGLMYRGRNYHFTTSKGLNKRIRIEGRNYKIN